MDKDNWEKLWMTGFSGSAIGATISILISNESLMIGFFGLFLAFVLIQPTKFFRREIY